MSDNPLVAEVTEPPSGLPLIDEFAGFVTDVETGSVVDPVISGATAALDMIATVTDPLAAVAAAGVAWLLENVQPLREALDELTGDPQEIASYAATWSNIATELNQAAEDLDNEVASGPVSEWRGATGDAYRQHIADNSSNLVAMATAAEAMSTATSGMGEVCAGVRELVVGIISDCVGALLAKLPRWIAETVGTLGIGLVAVIGEAIAVIAGFVRRITALFDALARTVG